MQRHFVFSRFICGLVLMLLGSVQAQEVQLQVQPAKCVSLNQGTICYQNIQLEWHAEQSADYCLFQQGQEQPLQCWQQQSQGRLKFEFAHDQTQHYILKKKREDQILATTVVEVKWVYKGRRNNRFGWRVF